MRNAFFVVSVLTLFGCRPSPEEARQIRSENIQTFGIAGLMFADGVILVPPGMKVVSLTYDDGKNAHVWSYILRPFREGEEPETYTLYRQSDHSERLESRVVVREQAKE